MIFKPFLAPLIIALLTSSVYLNSINNSFYFDDHHSILNNPYIRNLGNIPDFFGDPKMFSGDKTARMYRPLLLVTYAFNYKIDGYNPLGYHIVNILLHTLNTLLIYFILLSLLLISSNGSRLTAHGISALFPSLLFGVHTLNTQAVNYISSRSVLLATFFYLAAFYLYIKVRSRGEPMCSPSSSGQTQRSAPTVYLYLLSLFSYSLSLFSKEIAITLPLVLLLYDYLLWGRANPVPTSAEDRAVGGDECRLGGRHINWHMDNMAAESRGAASTGSGAEPMPRNRPQSEPKDSVGQTHRSAPTSYSLLSTLYSRLKFHLPYWAITSGYLLIRKSLMGKTTINLSFTAFTEGTVGRRGIYINLLTQAKANLFYIKSLFLPTGLSVDHDMKVAKGIGEPAVIFSITVILLLVFSAFILRKRYLTAVQAGWGMSFGILWFFIATMPESVVPLNVIINEHRAYLPMVGFAIFCGFFLYQIYVFWITSHALRLTATGIFILFILFNAFGTVSRNRVWKDEYVLWKDVIEKYPDSALAHASLGVVLQERSMLDEAILEYKEALRLQPFAGASPNWHYNIARAYQEKGLFDEAIFHYKKAIDYGLGNNADIHNNLGNIYAEKGLLKEAISEYKKALRIEPDHSLAIENLNIITRMLEQEIGTPKNSTTKGN